MNWRKKRLDELCEVFVDGDWIESKDQSPEGIRLVQTGNIGVGEYKDKSDKARYVSQSTFDRLKCTEVVPGDCLVSRLPEPVGRACIVPDLGQRMITGVDCSIIRFRKDEMEPEFFTYYSQAPEYLDDVAKLITGTTRDRISRSNLGSIPIPVPPKDVRQRIVTKLDAAFGALREAEGHVERNRANARELFESYLNGVFEGKEGWEEKTLGEIGKVCMCKRILKEQTTSTGDIPFYKIGTFGKEPDAYIPKEIYEEFKKKYSFPKKGDVLISASGTIGRGVVYDGEPAYFQDSNIVWIDNNEEQVLNEYLFQFYKVCEWSPTKGATISRLYNDDLRKARIAFPSLQEQRKLVAQMVELDAQTKALEATYEQKLRELEGLKKGLLGAAFRGEL